LFSKLFKSLILTPPADAGIDELDRFRIPANARFLQSTAPMRPTYPYSRIVKRIDGRNAVMREIDGHPDLHHYLWFDAGSDIPPACRWVIRGTAVFAHPDTSIIFGTASGTHDVSIRISRTSLSDFTELASETDIGSDTHVWVISRLSVERDRRLLAVAHSAAENAT